MGHLTKLKFNGIYREEKNIYILVKKNKII